MENIKDAELCKYFSWAAARKNGRACLKDPETPSRCKPFFYNCSCENYEETILEELIDTLED